MITFSKVTLPRKGQLAFWGGAVAKGKTQIHFEVAWVFLQHQHVCFFSSNPVSKSKIAFASSRYPTYTSDSNCLYSYDVIDDEYTIFLSELPCLVTPSLIPKCFLDLTDVTLACEVSRNLSLPYQLLSILTAMLLILDKTKAKLLILDKKSHVVDIRQNKSHVVDASWKQCTAINASLNFHGGSVKFLPAV